MREKSTVEITELKKKQDRLLVEKAQLWDHKVRLEDDVSDACQYVHESTTKLDSVEREKHQRSVFTIIEEGSRIAERA